jgi:MmgE/PrpD N-terminal domain
MTRLGRVISGPDILDRGIWPIYFSAPFGIAAVAARMLRLDANQTAHALALALTLAAPSVGQRHGQANCRKPGRPPIADAVGRRGESDLRALSPVREAHPDCRWHSHAQTASSL